MHSVPGSKVENTESDFFFFFFTVLNGLMIIIYFEISDSLIEKIYDFSIYQK